MPEAAPESIEKDLGVSVFTLIIGIMEKKMETTI